MYIKFYLLFLNHNHSYICVHRYAVVQLFIHLVLFVKHFAEWSTNKVLNIWHSNIEMQKVFQTLNVPPIKELTVVGRHNVGEIMTHDF